MVGRISVTRLSIKHAAKPCSRGGTFASALPCQNWLIVRAIDNDYDEIERTFPAVLAAAGAEARLRSAAAQKLLEERVRAKTERVARETPWSSL
jgi:hypothetical protein